jgi:simple sugar transport system ATP-binding protein
VLRGGRLVEGPMATTTTNAEHLASSIIGSAVEAALSGADREALVGASGDGGPAATAASRQTAPILEMKDVRTRPDPEGPALDNVTLTVGSGEIVGVAGVEGNGQRTLVRALSHLADIETGSIALGGSEVTRTALNERRANGLRVIPFERNSEGLSLSSALWENWAARLLLLGGALQLISPARLKRACDTTLKTWDVRFSSPSQPASSLSGGNARKLILAREIDDDATLIIAAQPTRGLDVGATAFVWQSLRAARARGCGILLISSDLDELFDISDRIIVMYSGRINGTFQPPYRLADVGSAMTGAGR